MLYLAWHKCLKSTSAVSRLNDCAVYVSLNMDSTSLKFECTKNVGFGRKLTVQRSQTEELRGNSGIIISSSRFPGSIAAIRAQFSSGAPMRRSDDSGLASAPPTGADCRTNCPPSHKSVVAASVLIVLVSICSVHWGLACCLHCSWPQYRYCNARSREEATRSGAESHLGEDAAAAYAARRALRLCQRDLLRAMSWFGRCLEAPISAANPFTSSRQ